MGDLVVAAHQPNYLPWLGFFYKVAVSDTFVLLDDVQFSKGSYTNRCTVRGKAETVVLSLPVSRVGHFEPIRAKTVEPGRFRRKHLTTFRQAYSHAPHLDEMMAVLEPHYDGGRVSLAAFNGRLIEAVVDFLGLNTRIVLQSQLQITGKDNHLLAELTRAVGGDVYLSGGGGRKYAAGHETAYTEKGVALAYQAFREPEDGRGDRGFTPGLSVVDALFWRGREARELLRPQADPPWTVVAAPQGN